MKRILTVLWTILLVIPLTGAQGQDGAFIFKTHCGACHSVGTGRLVGPDLAGITSRRDKAWIEDFIRNSAAMIARGDRDAVAIGKEYNNMLMPSFNGSATDLAAIMTFLGSSGGGPGNVSSADTFLNEAGAEHIERGRLLFDGLNAFKQGGAACISCHHTHASAIPGGTLSKSLNLSYAVLKGPGIRALLEAPPFPAMTMSYAGRPLTDQEVYDLAAYLKSVATAQITGNVNQVSLPFTLMGIAGTLLLVAAYGALWMKRKRRSVNHEIFSRQLATGK